jgi:hypothetical protein
MYKAKAQRADVLVLSLLIVGLTGALGCDASRPSGPTTKPPASSIPISTLATHGQSIVVDSRRFPCRPRSAWLPLAWGTVPERTKELAVVLTVNYLRRKHGSTISSPASEQVFAALRPSLHNLKRGKLPLGAFEVQQRNALQCPRASKSTLLYISVLALPTSKGIPRAEHVDINYVHGLTESALGSGHMVVAYR